LEKNISSFAVAVSFQGNLPLSNKIKTPSKYLHPSRKCKKQLSYITYSEN